jgi:DNA-binding protein Fis
MTSRAPFSEAKPVSISDAVLSGLTYPVLVLDPQNCFFYVNPAGEKFFKMGHGLLEGESLSSLIDPDHWIFGMIRRVRHNHASLSDQGIELMSSKFEQRLVDIQISPLAGARQNSGNIIITLQEHALAEHLQGQGQFQDSSGMDGNSLSDATSYHLARFFGAHDGELPASGLHSRILAEVERPLIEMTLQATGGNQIKAARVLGLNRNTLRKKIKILGISITSARLKKSVRRTN